MRARRLRPSRRSGILRSSAVTAKDPVPVSCAARDLHNVEPGCARLTFAVRFWPHRGWLARARRIPSARSSAQTVTAELAMRYSRLRARLRLARARTKPQAAQWNRTVAPNHLGSRRTTRRHRSQRGTPQATSRRPAVRDPKCSIDSCQASALRGAIVQRRSPSDPVTNDGNSREACGRDQSDDVPRCALRRWSFSWLRLPSSVETPRWRSRHAAGRRPC